MKKVSIKQNISALNKLSNRVPKSINEAINFEGFDDEEEMGGMDDKPMNEPMDSHKEMPEEGSELNVESFINDTRKKALKIMAKLADTPENPIYDLSKRIWQICDKAYNDQKEQQQGNMQGNMQQNSMHKSI